jgi:hypothetical protein
MGFASTPYTVTTTLLAAFAVFVIFIRLKGWIDSNIPLIFYLATITYMRAIQGAVPVWLICAGFGLTLLLRFEFMNPSFIRVARVLEIGVLGVLVYLCLTMIF